MVDDDPGIQEQAFHVLRHIADDDEGIDMIFREMGADILLQSLSGALESENDDLLRQVRSHLIHLHSSTLINSVRSGCLCTGKSGQQSIPSSPHPLQSSNIIIASRLSR